MTSPASGAPGTPILPDYAPVPRASLGPAVNDQGYYVGRIERNLYWVTDGDYHSAFLATPDGVVLFDAPPSIGHNLQRAVNDIAAAEGVSNTVTHLVYTHHHSDHAGASSLFGSNVVRIGHEEIPAAPAARRRPGQAGAGRDLRRPPHPGDRRRAHPAGVARLATTRRTTSTSTSRTTTPSCSSTSCSPAGRPSTASTSARTCPATWQRRPRRCPTPGSTSSPATWAGWAPATTSPCTSSTSPTSKPAPGRHWPRSTPPRTSTSTATTSGPRSRATWTRWRRRRRARHREVHRRAGRRGRVHGPHRLLDPGVDPPRPRLPHGRTPVSKP